MEITLEKFFKKADSEILPQLTNEMLFSYATKLDENKIQLHQTNEKEHKINYVQLKKTKFNTELRAIYSNADDPDDEDIFKVQLGVNETKNEILNLKCDKCDQEKGPCSHAVAFLFWVYRKSTDPPKTKEIYWPGEKNEEEDETNKTEAAVAEEETPATTPAIQMKNIFLVDESLIEGCEELDEFTEDEGQIFLNNILDEMDRVGLNESSFYKHCRPLTEEFEPLYIHHTMLDNANNYVKDFKTFIAHMENHGSEGLFEKLSNASVSQYKKQLWMEAQYGRIRCSLMHKISNRTDPSEDNAILDAILCQNREWSIEDRKQLKEHKRFILKQAEKLENKTYRKCGLLLSENYPYICAAPDGITDDHVVEIKAPKSDGDFEKYLVGKETIAPKYMAQIQIQMYLANVSRALYCVLSPSFDSNGALHYVWVQADMEMVASLLGAAEDYWKDTVFPRLRKIYIDE